METISIMPEQDTIATEKPVKKPRVEIRSEEGRFLVKAYKLGLTSRTRVATKLKDYRVSREDAKNIQKALQPVVDSLVKKALEELADRDFVIDEYNYAFVAFYIGRTVERELGKTLFELLVSEGLDTGND